jgi:chromosome segregation ATPase
VAAASGALQNRGKRADRPTCANIPNRNQRFLRAEGGHAMMTSLPAIVQDARGRLPAVVLLAFVFLCSAGAARAEDTDSNTVVSPVEEFSQQLEAFQKTVPDLNKTIQDSAGTIDSATDVEKARAEINRLRETVSTLLGAVSDNGPVSQLGAKALDHIHNKLKSLAQDNRFKPDERQFLIDQWKKLEVQTEGATKELDDARAQFAGLLHTLQDNEDFIGELIEIRQAEKALEVIRQLTHDIRDASTQLNKLIGGIKPPGA